MTASDYASIAAAVAAAVALILSIAAIMNSRRLSAQEQASTAARQYLELVLKYPQLTKATEAQKYEWLMQLYLFMCQSFFRAYSKHKVWGFLKQDLDNETDRALLRRWYTEDKHYFRKMFGRSVHQMIKQVLKDGAKQSGRAA